MMMEWRDYIKKLLSGINNLDGIRLSMSEDTLPIAIPPIVKASIQILDDMAEHQGIFNILVFPERIQSIFIFTLIKLIYDISDGRIGRNYDPKKFEKGDHLKLGKAVVSFNRIEEIDGHLYMYVQTSDLLYAAPIELFPLFQKTNAKRLSTNALFSEEKKRVVTACFSMSDAERYLKLFADYKTHMDSSIINMTSVFNTRELIANCRLCGQKLSDIILVGQTDYEGNIKNIGSGQLCGIPAIVLSSDLYAVAEASSKGHPIQSIIIDASNTNALLSQMDVLDELMRLHIPITCVTDTVNSFDLQPFLDRKFNLWRWDETSITEDLYNVSPLACDQKVKNYAHQKLEYCIANGKEISTAIQLLARHRKESETFSAQMLKTFDELYSLAFTALRQIIPFTEEQLAQLQLRTESCISALSAEKIFLSPEIYEDYSSVVMCFKKIFRSSYVFSKQEALKARLKQAQYAHVCIVIPERAEKSPIEDYWRHWCSQELLDTEITVLHPAEYYTAPCSSFSVTIVTGWLKRAIMRKILFSFNTEIYLILLYDYEKRWKNHDTARWKKSLNSTNIEIIQKSFPADQIHMSTSRFDPQETEKIDIPTVDEYAEIEGILRDNKFRRYVASGGSKLIEQTTEAIPVNFVGGFLSFYRTSHKIISATKIIMNDAEKIEMKFPQELNLGDFIVVRETDHDLIRDMADQILIKSNKENLREVASKWKEALRIEQLFYTDEQIFQRLQKVGCGKGYQAVHTWLTDEDVIAPQSKTDLAYIAKITGSGVLNERLDQIFDAAQTVRSAHIQAGRVLSTHLRRRIAQALKEYGDIDPFNIWQPIELQLEDVGLVRILKIIDIASAVTVDITNTNRLIDEE